MPYNGVGTFIALPPPDYPAVAGELIRATYHNNNLTDIFSGLSNAITRDGQSPPTANLPMAGKRLTNAGDAVLDQEYMTKRQLGSHTTGEGAAFIGIEGTGGGFLNELVNQVRGWVSPLDSRFGGISGGSWHTAINAAGVYAKANNLGLELPRRSGDYPCTGKVLIPSGIHFRGNWSKIIYSGTRPGNAVEIGETGVSNNGWTCRGLWVEASGALQWPGTVTGSDVVSTNDVGAKFFNMVKGEIEVQVTGFTGGYELATDSTEGSAYNQIWARTSDCKYGEIFKSYVASGFPNENNVWGGRRGCSSSAALLGNAYGTVYTYDHNVAGAYKNHNNNHHTGVCYELQTAGTERLPVWMDNCGQQNYWEGSRHETGVGGFAKCDGTAVFNNVFEVSYINGASVVGGITETNGAAANAYRSALTEQRTDITWFSGEIANYISGRIANTPYISGPFHWVQNTATFVKTLTSSAYDYGFEAGKEYGLFTGTAGVGVFVDTSKAKKFYIALDAIDTFVGRFHVQCFDASGAVLSGTSPSYAVSTSSAGLGSSALFGNCYRTGTDTMKNAHITVDAAVKYVRMFFTGGTNALKLVSFSITALGMSADNPLHVWSGPTLNDDPTLRMSSANPGTAGEHGRYALGNIVWSDAAAGAFPLGWRCTTAGGLAKVWVALSTYTVGQVRKNGTNLYVVTTGGNAAGAGGPTGTGTGIVDGTVVWNFLRPAAVFA